MAVCRDDEFQCAANGVCIPVQFVCNYVDDCGDRSDEVNCGELLWILFMVQWFQGIKSDFCATMVL